VRTGPLRYAKRLPYPGAAQRITGYESRLTTHKTTSPNHRHPVYGTSACRFMLLQTRLAVAMPRRLVAQMHQRLLVLREFLCALTMFSRREHRPRAHDVELSFESGVLDDEKIEYGDLLGIGQWSDVAFDLAAEFGRAQFLVVGRKDVPEPGQIHLGHDGRPCERVEARDASLLRQAAGRG